MDNKLHVMNLRCNPNILQKAFNEVNVLKDICKEHEMMYGGAFNPFAKKSLLRLKNFISGKTDYKPSNLAKDIHKALNFAHDVSVLVPGLNSLSPILKLSADKVSQGADLLEKYGRGAFVGGAYTRLKDMPKYTCYIKPKRKVRQPSNKVNPWIVHVKNYREQNPKLSYKEAIKQAKESYGSGFYGGIKRSEADNYICFAKPKRQARKSVSKGNPWINFRKQYLLGNPDSTIQEAAEEYRKIKKKKGKGFYGGCCDYPMMGGARLKRSMGDDFMCFKDE